MDLQPFTPASGPLASLPLLRLETAGPVLHVRLNRPAKRNSVSDELLAQLHTVWVNIPSSIKVAVLSGEGAHFCAGLDLSEVSERTVAEGLQHSRAWHACCLPKWPWPVGMRRARWPKSARRRRGPRFC
jgi:hypothetical protein